MLARAANMAIMEAVSKLDGLMTLPATNRTQLVRSANCCLKQLLARLGLTYTLLPGAAHTATPASSEAVSKPEEPTRLHHEDAAGTEAAAEAAADSHMPHWLAFLRLPAAVWRQLTLNEPRSCQASIAGVCIRCRSLPSDDVLIRDHEVMIGRQGLVL